MVIVMGLTYLGSEASKTYIHIQNQCLMLNFFIKVNRLLLAVFFNYGEKRENLNDFFSHSIKSIYTLNGNLSIFTLIL